MLRISLVVTGIGYSEPSVFAQIFSITAISATACEKYSLSKFSMLEGVARDWKCEAKPSAISSAQDKVSPLQIRTWVTVLGIVRCLLISR